MNRFLHVFHTVSLRGEVTNYLNLVCEIIEIFTKEKNKHLGV